MREGLSAAAVVRVVRPFGGSAEVVSPVANRPSRYRRRLVDKWVASGRGEGLGSLEFLRARLGSVGRVCDLGGVTRWLLLWWALPAIS